MKLSTRGRYGVRALLELSLHAGEGPISLKDIARNQEISLQYLEHLITPLLAGGLIKSTRGAKGGISLAKAPGDIRLTDVIRLLEGSTAPVDCVDKPDSCNRSGTCVTRDVWTDVRDAINDVLENTTLEDLVERQKRKLQTEEITYYI